MVVVLLGGRGRCLREGKHSQVCSRKRKGEKTKQCGVTIEALILASALLSSKTVLISRHCSPRRLELGFSGHSSPEGNGQVTS